MNTDAPSRFALLETLLRVRARDRLLAERAEAEIAALTRQLLADGSVGPGELLHLHQRCEAAARAALER